MTPPWGAAFTFTSAHAGIDTGVVRYLHRCGTTIELDAEMVEMTTRLGWQSFKPHYLPGQHARVPSLKDLCADVYLDKLVGRQEYIAKQQRLGKPLRSGSATVRYPPPGMTIRFWGSSGNAIPLPLACLYKDPTAVCIVANHLFHGPMSLQGRRHWTPVPLDVTERLLSRLLYRLYPHMDGMGFASQEVKKLLRRLMRRIYFPTEGLTTLQHSSMSG